MFWIPLAAGAGLGLLKNIEGENQASAERNRQAAIARYSPWTGMQAHTVQDPSLIGNLATGAAIGSAGSGLLQGSTPPPVDTSDNDFNSWLSLMKQRGGMYSQLAPKE